MADDRTIHVDSRRYDLLLLVAANSIWGATDVAAKYALVEMSPAAVAWTRFSIALLAFAPVMYKRRSEIPRSLSGLWPFMALGFCGFFGNFVLHYYGLELSTASHATALRISEALAIVLLSYLILGERIGRRAILGLVLGGVGVVMVLDLNFRDLSFFGSGYLLGDLFIMAGIFVEGLYTIIGKRVLVNTRPLTATALACFFGWLMLTVFFGPSVAGEIVATPPGARALIACAYLGLLASALGYWIWYTVLRRRASHRVGITIMVQPMVGIPLAALALGERMGWVFFAGAAMIAIGVYFAFGKDSPESDSGFAGPKRRVSEQ